MSGPANDAAPWGVWRSNRWHP